MTKENLSSPPGVLRLTTLGIGSMVGAGIFALMGEAAVLAGPAVWMSFALAGVIALLTGHSFVQLAVRYPSRGGLVEYLVQAYGTGVFSGSCSLLFYISQLIGMAMISLAFGKFLAKLLAIETNLLLWERVLACGLIIGLAGLTVIGSKVLSRMQRGMVIFNLVLLSGFTIALSAHSSATGMPAETSPGAMSILGSLSLTFMAFTGFAVISNAADRVKNPARDLPRAMYLAIGLVLTLYVAMALALANAVGAETMSSAGAALLVTAARTLFGEIGYYALLLTAIAGTVTCLNGGLFGAANITFSLAEKGQLPSKMMQEFHASTRGLTITAAVAIALVLSFDLASVASLGAATSLMVYMLVNIGALKLIEATGLRWLILRASVASCAFAIIVWSVYTIKTKPSSFLVFSVFLVASFAGEMIIQRVTKRRVMPEAETSGVVGKNKEN